MHAHDFLKRQQEQHRLNAIAPYTWEAEYRGGGRLKQFDVDGYHKSLEIDRLRIRALIIHRHPSGPIRIEVPGDQPGPPDDVRIQATTAITMGASTGHAVTFWFGYRYGTQWYLVGIDSWGRVFTSDRFEAPPHPAGQGALR